MHPADIKAALEKCGCTQAAIARSLLGRKGQRLSRMAVHLVLVGRSKSTSVARRISVVTGIPVGQLWPGKYPDLEKLDRLARDDKALAAAIQSSPAALAGQIAALRRKTNEAKR